MISKETVNKIVKNTGSLVIGLGVSQIAKNIIKATTPLDTKLIMRICIFTGGYFIGNVCNQAATDRFEKTVDNIKDIFIKKGV